MSKVSKEEYINGLPIADKFERGYGLSKKDALSEEGLLLIQCLTRDGYRQEDIAKAFGVSRVAFYKWKKENPEIEEAVRRGKKIVDYQVENALLKCALGHKVKEANVQTTICNGVIVETVKSVTTKEIAPNVTACLAWLNNRNPDKWRKNRDNEIDARESEKGITINIVKGKGVDDETEIEVEAEQY